MDVQYAALWPLRCAITLNATGLCEACLVLRRTLPPKSCTLEVRARYKEAVQDVR